VNGIGGERLKGEGERGTISLLGVLCASRLGVLSESEREMKGGGGGDPNRAGRLKRYRIGREKEEGLGTKVLEGCCPWTGDPPHRPKSWKKVR